MCNIFCQLASFQTLAITRKALTLAHRRGRMEVVHDFLRVRRAEAERRHVARGLVAPHTAQQADVELLLLQRRQVGGQAQACQKGGERLRSPCRGLF